MNGKGNMRLVVCVEDSCKNIPTHNFEGSNVAILCNDHKIEEMVPLFVPEDKLQILVPFSSQCQEKFCKLEACYRFNKSEPALFCTMHKREGMQYSKGKGCAMSGCTTRGSYSLEDQPSVRYCCRHKTEKMTCKKSCAYEGCNTQATFAFAHSRGMRFCSKHKMEGMVQWKISCQHVVEVNGSMTHCPNKALYRFPVGRMERSPRYCEEHKVVGMVIINAHRKCAGDGCNKEASYRWRDREGGAYCATHREEGMVNFKTLLCAEDGCSLIGYYYAPGLTSVRFCKEHKSKEMITRNACQHEGCQFIASFNFKGKGHPVFCKSHHLSGMVDLRHNLTKLCSRENCMNRAYYVGRVCGKHRPKEKRAEKSCQHSDCFTEPAFNFPGEQKPVFCNAHKLNGMINVKQKKCEHPGCDKSGHHRFKGTKIQRFCLQHYPHGPKQTRMCTVQDCREFPFYNYKGRKQGRFCEQHKREEMVYMKSASFCEHGTCTKRAAFNTAGETKRRFCTNHKHPGMVKIKGSTAAAEPKAEP